MELEALGVSWMRKEFANMSKAAREPVTSGQIITVGELIDKLCDFPDAAEVRFRCNNQELRFCRLQKQSKDVIELEIDAYRESPPVVPPAEPLEIGAPHTKKVGGSSR
jgi:hypothetical protein